MDSKEFNLLGRTGGKHHYETPAHFTSGLLPSSRLLTAKFSAKFLSVQVGYWGRIGRLKANIRCYFDIDMLLVKKRRIWALISLFHLRICS